MMLGQITGYGEIGDAIHAFLPTAVPEPSILFWQYPSATYFPAPRVGAGLFLAPVEAPFG